MAGIWSSVASKVKCKKIFHEGSWNGNQSPYPVHNIIPEQSLWTVQNGKNLLTILCSVMKLQEAIIWILPRSLMDFDAFLKMLIINYQDLIYSRKTVKIVWLSTWRLMSYLEIFRFINWYIGNWGLLKSAFFIKTHLYIGQGIKLNGYELMVVQICSWP